MAVYMNWHSLASTIKNLEYSNQHTSSLNNPDEVNRRIEALEFWRKHGLSSAMDHAGVSRSTLLVGVISWIAPGNMTAREEPVLKH